MDALHALETATNLEGVRHMKAFVTTRLIDHYQHMVWAQGEQRRWCGGGTVCCSALLLLCTLLMPPVISNFDGGGCDDHA